MSIAFRINGKRIFTMTLVLMIPGFVYLVPGIPTLNVGELLMMFTVVLSLFLSRGKISFYVSTLFCIFLIYSVIISILFAYHVGGRIGSITSRLARDGFYWLVILFFGSCLFDIERFRKWYWKLCVFLTLYIVVQFICYMVFHIYLPGFLLNVPINQGDLFGRDVYNHYVIIASQLGYLKANGFLVEPAHCAQVLFLGMVLVISDENRIHRGRRLFFLSLGSVLTFSANAFAFTIIAWFLFISVRKTGKLKILKAILIGVVVALITILVAELVQFSMIEDVILRIRGATDKSTADVSSYWRIYQGVDNWLHLPAINKVFGIGFGNYDVAYSAFGFSEEIEYMNSASYILLNTGVLGFLLFLCVSIKLYLECNLPGKLSVFILMLMSLTCSIYSTPIFACCAIVAINDRKTNLVFQTELGCNHI